MTDLYVNFNVVLCDLFESLFRTYPDNENIKEAKTQNSHKFATFRRTKELFEKYDGSFSKEVLDAINERNSKKLFRDSQNVFTRDIGGQKIFEDIRINNEQDCFWKSTQNLARTVTILRATGPSLGIFENVAKTFVNSNKGLDPKNYQSALFSQLFGNTELSGQLSQAFKNPESIKSIFNNMGPVLKSLAPSSTEYKSDDEESEDISVNCSEEVSHYDSDNNANSEKSSKEDDDDEYSSKTIEEDDDIDNKESRKASRVFAKIKSKRRRAKNKRKKKTNKNSSVFTDLAEMIGSVELDDSELKELHSGVINTLQGKTDSDEGGVDVMSLMRKLTSGDTKGVNEILKDDGKSSENHNIIESLTESIKSFQSGEQTGDLMKSFSQMMTQYTTDDTVSKETTDHHHSLSPSLQQDRCMEDSKTKITTQEVVDILSKEETQHPSQLPALPENDWDEETK